MAYLLTDAGEYRPLPCPATFSIGRANDNSFRPESQSVSKRHAILETSFLYGTEKIEVSIEDLKSTNGTFVGDSPLDFEPVVGKRKISFGTYIRFGFSQKYFRLVDRITEINPVQDEIEVVAPSFPATRKSNGNFQSAEIIDESVAHGRINDGFLQLTKAKWAGGEGREFLTSSVFGPCKELINKSLLSEKITSKMQASINNFTPFIPYGVENCSLQDYINSTEIIRGIWFELFDFNTSIIPNSLHGNQLLCYFLNLKSLPELLEVTTKEIEGDDTLLIDLMLASQRCDLQSFIRDIGGAIHLFQKILIVSIRSEITSSTGEGPSNEISSALLTEIASTLISCCKKIQHHETISISKMVESCYKLGPTATSELESLLSFLQDVGGSLNQNGLSILHRDEINSIVRNCTRLFVEANLILTCYYIVFLSVALCLQEKLEIYMKSKNGKEAHTLLDNFRQAVLQGDDDTLNKLIENIRAKDQQVIGRRNLKLLRCIEIISDQSVKNCLNKWRHETKKSKHSDLLLFDKIEYRKLKQKRQLLNVWRECFGRRAQMRKLLNRMTRALNSNAFKLRLIAFRTWAKTVATSNKNIPELVGLKLECAKLQNELDGIRSSDKIADSLAAEKALNRELHSMNIRLRSQIQYLENKLLDAASAAPVERRDLVYRHLLSKEEKLESLEREIQLLNDEMETVRTKLSFNAKSSSILANNPPRKANPPKFVLNEKEQALGVIFHEVRRLKEGYSLLKNEKEILDLQITESKLVTMDIQRANQKLAARVIELERSGAVLRELLRQKVGNDGLLDVINALTKTALDSSALLQPELTSKFTEHTVPTSVVHQHLNFSTRNTPSGREATEDYKKIVATLFS